MSAIRNIAQCDVVFCQELFQVLMPAAWSLMPNNKWRSAFVPPLESLLSQPHHSQFLKHSHGFITSNNSAGVCGDGTSQPLCRNVVQSFLQMLSRLDPCPQISSDLLMHLANEYNCWHEVLALLENQYCIAQGCGTPSSYQQDLMDAAMAVGVTNLPLPSGNSIKEFGYFLTNDMCHYKDRYMVEDTSKSLHEKAPPAGRARAARG